MPTYSNQRTQFEELGVMLGMMQVGYCLTARRLADDIRAPLDCEAIISGQRRVLFDVKVRDINSHLFPTIRISKAKYNAARALMAKGELCRYVVQYVDRAISYYITTEDLPVHEGRRHDRPGVISPCVDMPKNIAKVLWDGSVIQRHVDMAAAAFSR